MSITSFSLMIVMSLVATSLTAQQVDYVRNPSAQHTVLPLDAAEVCRWAAYIAGLTNVLQSQCHLVGWVVKKADSDQPPVLIEEVIVSFEADGTDKRHHVLACVERTVARGRPGADEWRGVNAEGMQWIRILNYKPTIGDLKTFMKNSNFGYNECIPERKPIYVSIYFPYKSLLKTARSGISDGEKSSRSLTSSTRIWD